MGNQPTSVVFVGIILPSTTTYTNLHKSAQTYTDVHPGEGKTFFKGRPATVHGKL